MNQPTFAHELSAVAVWLTLHPADWCIMGLSADRLDVAVDADSLDAILRDLRGEGFRVQVDARAQVVQVDGHQLRVRLCHGPQIRALARSVVRCPVLGQMLPVAAPTRAAALAA